MLSTLFKFARIWSFQEICYLAKDLIKCRAKTVCIKKPINYATSNRYLTLENMRKCMGQMHLRLRDLLSDINGHRHLSTNSVPG